MSYGSSVRIVRMGKCHVNVSNYVIRVVPWFGEWTKDGDAIFLEPSSILIDNTPLSSMTEAEQFAAMSLAGMSQFQAGKLDRRSHLSRITPGN